MARMTFSDDWQQFTNGDYTVVNNVWNKGGRVNGVDYTQTVSFDDADLSRDLNFAWDWGGNAGQVLAYPEVVVGYKPWDQAGTDVLSSRISDIRDFSLYHDLAIGGPDTDLFNVAYDLWLTDTPLGGIDSITTELMVWAHAGGIGAFNTEAHVGTYDHDGYKAEIYTYADFGGNSNPDAHAWRYIAFVPDEDHLEADIDMHDILMELVERGLISDLDFLTGYELGAEVTGGKGSLDINQISHDLDTYDANAQANTLVGTAGRDRIYGLGGNDMIRGNAGDDHLSGGWGHDILTGNKGKDVFHFNQLARSSDVISDFVTHVDRISLDGPIFLALGTGPLTEDEFKTGMKFDADTRILYRKAYGELYYDADGSASGDTAHLFATLNDYTKLKYSDFDVL
ncbi:MAG: hypothetical protein JWM58_2564 [Rhizobium sp.]|nr:hypothetical protein [Rhizobium sp.]